MGEIVGTTETTKTTYSGWPYNRVKIKKNHNMTVLAYEELICKNR